MWAELPLHDLKRLKPYIHTAGILNRLHVSSCFCLGSKDMEGLVVVVWLVSLLHSLHSKAHEEKPLHFIPTLHVQDVRVAIFSRVGHGGSSTSGVHFGSSPFPVKSYTSFHDSTWSPDKIRLTWHFESAEDQGAIKYPINVTLPVHSVHLMERIKQIRILLSNTSSSWKITTESMTEFAGFMYTANYHTSIAYHKSHTPITV